MEIDEVIFFLDKQFHLEYQEEYDNAGFLLGDGKAKYKGALVALDLTPAVVNEAIENDLNLIVTHHPFIFSGIKRITMQDVTGRMIVSLVRNGISVYAAHTNLDNLMDGVNGILAEKIGLLDCRILRPMDGDENLGAGMIGELPETEAADDFLMRVKRRLELPFVRCSEHDPQAQIRRVAVCGGAGSFLIQDAICQKADIYLTADMKYHDFQRAEECITLADIGHYESEQFAKEVIFSAIKEKFSNFACRISEDQKGIVSYI